MKYWELDTPSLMIDREIMLENLRFMQDWADNRKVALRPHTKTHKMPYIARLQKKKNGVPWASPSPRWERLR